MWGWGVCWGLVGTMLRISWFWLNVLSTSSQHPLQPTQVYQHPELCSTAWSSTSLLYITVSYSHLMSMQTAKGDRSDEPDRVSFVTSLCLFEPALAGIIQGDPSPDHLEILYELSQIWNFPLSCFGSTPEIESRIPICPRENLSYLWPYPIYDTNIEIPDSFERWKTPILNSDLSWIRLSYFRSLVYKYSRYLVKRPTRKEILPKS